MVIKFKSGVELTVNLAENTVSINDFSLTIFKNGDWKGDPTLFRFPLCFIKSIDFEVK